MLRFSYNKYIICYLNYRNITKMSLPHPITNHAKFFLAKTPLKQHFKKTCCICSSLVTEINNQPFKLSIYLQNFYFCPLPYPEKNLNLKTTF